MAKRKGASITIGTEDIAYTVGGALAAIVVNGALNSALQNQPENTRETIGKVLPALKVAGGGFLATNKKMARMYRMAGIGMAVTGGIELGVKFAPNYFGGIGNTQGNVFELLAGSSDMLELPIVPSAPLERSPMEENILGTYGDGDLSYI